MDTPFQRVCEGAAEQWEVPALVAGMSLGGREEVAAVGCDASARFRIASVTKPVTALAALILLELEEPTRVWPDDVLVRNVLSHTSGFDCELPDGDNARFGEGDDALGRCVEELPAIRRFVGSGEVWSYANSGYWLAGWLSAERAGATYEDVVTRQVLRPASLEATAFDDPDLEGTGDLVLPGPYPRSRRPSGGLVSNVSDLLRLGRFLLAADVFPRMRTPHGSPIGGVYGLGLFGERVGGVEVWGHGGSWGGFQSILLLVPERDAVFAGLTNASLGGKALRLVEDAFLEQAIGSRRVEPPYRKLDLSAFASFAGTYENSDGRYVVEPAGDGLLVHVAGEELIGLPLDEQTFRVPLGKHVGERFDFPRDGILRFGGRLAARAA